MYLDVDCAKDYFKERMVEKMEERKEEAVEAVANIVGKELAEAFTKVLSSAYEYGCPEAIRLASCLGLDDDDFLCIEEKYDEFVDRMNQIYEARYVSAMED